MEDCNKRVKHDCFEKGLPSTSRVDKFVLANDRVREILEWNATADHVPSVSYYDRETNSMEQKVRLMLQVGLNFFLMMDVSSIPKKTLSH